MDPYEHQGKTVLSPLDKPPAAAVEAAAVAMPEPPSPPEFRETDEPAVEGTLVDHLSDLRKQLVKSAAVFVIFFIAVFSTINYWFPYVTKGNELVVLGPLEVVKFYMSISTAISLGLSLPFLFHFIWQFVKPGLNTKESSFIGMYSPLMLILFVIGIAFGYFVVNPLSYEFLIRIGEVNFDVMVSAGEYVHFLIMTTVPLGLLFQLPIIAMFLSAIGILTSDKMKHVRKWSYVVLGLVSTLMTPPDFVSDLLIMVPMILLYEISILIVIKLEKKQILNEKASISQE